MVDESTRERRERLGAEIRRVREMRPKISRQRVADEANIAEGTVRAVERGASTDHSVRLVMDALARLGRPVDSDAFGGPAPLPGHRPQPVSRDEGARGGTSEGLNQVDLTVRLVESTLRASPPDERHALSGYIWLLVRGREAELVKRLSATPDGPAADDAESDDATPPA
jgi:transcriptional regulator with XRE-family HTH domain